MFIFCFTSLGIVLLLGDQHTKTLEEQILRQTSVLLDLPAASALALAQLLVVSVALILGARAISTTTYRPTTAALRPLPASTGGRVALFGCAGLGAIGVLAPVISLVIASVSSAHGMTWQWWATLKKTLGGGCLPGSGGGHRRLRASPVVPAVFLAHREDGSLFAIACVALEVKLTP